MGLAAADLAFCIESEFDIDFDGTDYDALVANRDIVVQDLYDHLLAKLQLRDTARNDIALSYALWHHVQSLLHESTNIETERIGLRTSLAELFPRKARRQRWDEFRERSPYTIAELDYPPWVRHIAFALAAGVVLIEQFNIWQFAWLPWLWLGVGLFGLWMIFETYTRMLNWFAPLRSRFPARMQTVKDLCRAVMATHYETLARTVPMHDPRSSDVWQRLVRVVVDVLGVDETEVTFHSRLIADLGMQ